jgi:hypothetical protein
LYLHHGAQAQGIIVNDKTYACFAYGFLFFIGEKNGYFWVLVEQRLAYCGGGYSFRFIACRWICVLD